MTKSTAPVEPVGLHSSPSAYYSWEFPEKPVSVRLSLDVVDRLEHDVLESFRAITARGSEVGGLLLGRSEQGGSFKTIVENYELFHCDYSRGPLYLLSDEEKGRMEDVIRRKKTIPGQAGSVVGFFRSNTRKDLALDDEDLEMFGKYFSRPEQVFLLVKPYAAKASAAGIFIWEGGRVRGEGSYIEFPFRRADLGKGDFAKSIVLDAPKPKESPAEPAPSMHKASRAQVLPFSLKRDDEPPVPAPPLKREERAPVVPLTAKSAEPEVPTPRKPAETAATPAPSPRVTTPKSAPALPPLREEKRQEKREEKRQEKKESRIAESSIPAPAAPAEPAAKAEKSEDKAPAFAEKATESKPVITAEPLPDRSVFGGRKLWALFGGLAMFALAGGTLYYLKSGATAPATVSLTAAGFQLKAENANGQLRVSWNRDAKPIKSAQSAVLSISDGSKTEDVPLDLTQLLAGGIMYAPLSTDVAFRLEVKDGKSGATRSEYIRVPLASIPDLNSVPRPNPADSSKAPAVTPSVQPQQAIPQPGVNTAARGEAPAQPNSDPPSTAPAAPVPPPAKPFSLASRVRPAESDELPEAPSVEAAGGIGTVRPSAPVRLPAPAPPPPAPAPAVSPTQTPSSPAPAATAPPATNRVAGKVQEPKLIRRVDAIYPPMARQARVSGVVRIQATVGKDGKVKKLEVLSGPPLLKQAAIDAVQKWVYSPSMLNGAPVDSTTNVDVSFSLGSQ